VDRNDPTTHDSKSGYAFPRTVEGGLMPYYGSGHSSLAWKIRSHPAVRTVFASLYNESTLNESEALPLVSSLDGFVLWTTRNMLDSEDAGWFHVDQNPKCKPHHEAMQGLVNLVPVTKETGGNALVVRSHIDFSNGHYCTGEARGTADPSTQSSTYPDPSDAVAAFYEKRLEEIGNDDWLEIDPNDQMLHPCRVVTVLLGAGDMLLWDSRLAHCSYPPTLPATETIDVLQAASRKGFLRAATLVSMIRATPTVPSQITLNARKEAVHSWRTLTHWVNKVAPLGEERGDDAMLEKKCVEYIKAQQELADGARQKVLLGWEDLDPVQKLLVIGNLAPLANLA
jgi:hypothetical protein